jgi:hypothetical protein
MERSETITLGTLVTLAHFSHFHLNDVERRSHCYLKNRKINTGSFTIRLVIMTF